MGVLALGNGFGKTSQSCHSAKAWMVDVLIGLGHEIKI